MYASSLSKEKSWDQTDSSRQNVPGLVDCRTASSRPTDSNWGPMVERQYRGMNSFYTMIGGVWYSMGDWLIIVVFFFLWCIKSHSWSVKQQLHRQQSVVETSHYITSSEDKSRQCGTSFTFHHKDTNQWLPGSISSYRHHSYPVQSENSWAGTTVVVDDQTWLPNGGIIH